MRGSGHFGPEATYHGELSNSRTLGLIRQMSRSPLPHITLRPSSLLRTQPLRSGFLFLPHQTQESPFFACSPGQSVGLASQSPG